VSLFKQLEMSEGATIIMLKFILIILCLGTELCALEPVIILFGPPGAGKGTFSQFVKSRYDYIHLSVGDIIRDEIDRQTNIGKEAEKHLQQGTFLEESMIQAIVLMHIAPLALEKKPFILDGFPRTEEAIYFIQECFNRSGLKNNDVLLIMLTASDETCYHRILSRLICKGCGYVFNTLSTPPQQQYICDHCGSPLKSRSNDTEEIIKKRLKEYHEVTEKAYDLATLLFSHFEFITEVSIKDCLQNYSHFLDER
jgi:adenylate kinase